MIDSRIRITTVRPDGDNEEARAGYNGDVMGEILAGAQAAAEESGKAVVRVEVEYPEEDWDVSGDALEVDFSADPVSVVTLPPYSEVAP